MGKISFMIKTKLNGVVSSFIQQIFIEFWHRFFSGTNALELGWKDDQLSQVLGSSEHKFRFRIPRPYAVIQKSLLFQAQP